MTFKSLSDPVRIRILNILSNGEQCVCNLVQILNIPQSTISRQLGILKNAEIINIRKEGLWHYYDLNKQKNLNIELFDFLGKQMKHDPIFTHDNEKLKNELSCPPASKQNIEI